MRRLPVLASLSLVVSAAFVYLPAATLAGVVVPTCFGMTATMVGSEDADTIDGTSGDDVIVSLGGNDTITGGAGSDRICAGDGDDQVTGGTGPVIDSLDGGAGDDVLAGGILAAPECRTAPSLTDPDDGNNILWGGAGDDQLFGGPIGDTAQGQEGNDCMVLGGGGDYGSGGGGTDFIDAGFGDDYAKGGRGADAITDVRGTGDIDRIVGNNGPDRLNVADGDTLDTVVGARDVDTCDWDTSSPGSDTYGCEKRIN